MSLDVQILRDGKTAPTTWNAWTLQCLALVHAVEDGVVTMKQSEDIQAMDEELDKLQTILSENDDIAPDVTDDLANVLHRIAAVFWDIVWKHFWDTKSWRSGKHEVQDEYSFRLNLKEDMFGFKAGQTLKLEKGDVISTNIF